MTGRDFDKGVDLEQFICGGTSRYGCPGRLVLLIAWNSTCFCLIEVFVVCLEMCSERASETNNAGQKLRDGANINRSLLALANCINALGKQQKKGLAYVPYRNRYSLIKRKLARNFPQFYI